MFNNYKDNRSEDDKLRDSLHQIRSNQRKGEQQVKENMRESARLEMIRNPEGYTAQMDKAFKEAKDKLEHNNNDQSFTISREDQEKWNYAFKYNQSND